MLEKVIQTRIKVGRLGVGQLQLIVLQCFYDLRGVDNTNRPLAYYPHQINKVIQHHSASNVKGSIRRLLAKGLLKSTQHLETSAKKLYYISENGITFLEEHKKDLRYDKTASNKIYNPLLDSE